jgi:hypothetical protein
MKVVEKIITQILSSVNFFFAENHIVYEKMWEKMVGPEATDDSIIGRMHIACWIYNVTGTHSDYIILNASPR